MSKAKPPPAPPASPFDTKAARRFLARFRDVAADGEEMRREIDSIHDARTRRMAAAARKVSPERLRALATSEQAARSRITAILLDIDAVLGSVERMRDAVVAHTIANPPPGAKPFKSVTDHRLYLRSGLEARLPWLDGVVAARDAAKYVIEDIDKAAWALRLTATTFELGTRPELS